MGGFYNKFYNRYRLCLADFHLHYTLENAPQWVKFSVVYIWDKSPPEKLKDGNLSGRELLEDLEFHSLEMRRGMTRER